MKLLYLALLFGLTLAVDDPDVLVLTESNFDDIVNSAEFIVVEFYAPWCGHCKHLAPEWAKAATTLKQDDPPVPLAKVDATVESSLGSRFGVNGYPTIKIFRNGVASDYQGPRDANGIVSYVRKQAGPAAKPLNSKESLEKFKAFKEDVGAVGYFKDASSPNAKVFAAVANTLRDDFRFGLVTDASLIESEGIVLYRPITGEDKVVTFGGKFNAEEIKKFLNEKSVPLAGVYNNNVAKRFHLPRVTLFTKADPVADAKQIVYYLNRLRKVAKDYVGKLHFVLADKSEQGGDFSTLGFDSSAKWGLAIVDPAKGKYKHSGETFSPEVLKTFVDDYLQGKVEKHVKSEPVPSEPTKDGLTTLVGKTIDDVINDPTKDVFIEFYAPWCGHCKSLAPKWEQLAKDLTDVESLVIAKVDATANDIPPIFNVRGYPTIYLLKANDKKNPISYDKDREVKPMKKWLAENVHFKFSKKDL